MGNHKSKIDGEVGGGSLERGNLQHVERRAGSQQHGMRAAWLHNSRFRCGAVAAASAASKRDTHRWSEQIHIFQVA